MKNHIKNSHCSYCGTSFGTQTTWPRHCSTCNNQSFINPIPVAVSLVKVFNSAPGCEGCQAGILLVQRNIEPKKGEWALPGGYINAGETWQEGSSRELEEETGLKILPADMKLVGLDTAGNGNLLVFSIVNKALYENEINFSANAEVSAIKIVYHPVELAFPSHTQMLKDYFLDG